MFYGNTILNQQQDNNSWLDESINPFYEETFYNEFYNAYWALNNEIEFHSILEAEGFELSTELRANKADLSSGISKLISAVFNWIKEAFKNLANGIKKLKDKIVNNTFKDKALQKLFNNYSYDNITEAREKGWKGIPKTYPMPILEDINADSIYQAYKNYNEKYCKGDLDKIVDDMESDQILDHAEESYKKVMDTLKEYKSMKELKFEEWWQGNYIPNIKIADGYAYGSKDEDEYYYPMKPHFDHMQDIVLHSQQKILMAKKYFDDNFKKIADRDIFESNFELKKMKSADDEASKAYKYYLKAKIAVSMFKLQLIHNIMKNYTKSINDEFKLAFAVYKYIVASTKIYLLTDTIKNKVAGKEKKPEAAEANG